MAPEGTTDNAAGTDNNNPGETGAATKRQGKKQKVAAPAAGLVMNIPPRPKLTKAERRALQEERRAAKAASRQRQNGLGGGGGGGGQTQNQQQHPQTQGEEQQHQQPKKTAEEESSKADANNDNAPTAAAAAGAGGGGRNNNNKGKDKKISHSLSWALRHAAPELGLSMTSDGFVPVEELIRHGHPKLRCCSAVADIRRVVETNDKQRFKLAERRPAAGDFCERRPANNSDDEESSSGNVLCIRANQGHSIAGIIDPSLLLTRLTPQELAHLPVIVHGTYRRAWETGISRQGLKRMSRNHIHFASGLPTHDDRKSSGGGAIISGMRKSCEIFIFINGPLCAERGVAFFRSDNGVLLTAGAGNDGVLPVQYFSHVTCSAGNILLDQRTTTTTTKTTTTTSGR